METSEVLNRAADLIEERGWHTGSYDGTTTLCLETAVTSAMGLGAGIDSWVEANTCAAGRALRDYLQMGEFDYGLHTSLWWWNDRTAETAPRVVEALRAAAVIEAARETEARLPHGPRIPQPADQRPGGAA